MKKTFHLPALICAGIAGAAIGVACLLGFYCAQFGGFDSYAAARKFSRVYNIIDRQYVGDADMQEIADGAYTGMVYATGDKWSMYLNADEYKRMQEYSSNSYSGIGVTIKKDDASGLYAVAVVRKDTPASRAGVQIGDRLTSIGDTSLKGKNADQIHALFTAQKGDFQLGLLVADGSERRVTVSNEQIYTTPVSYELLPDGIGYVAINNFESGAGDEIIAAVDSLQQQGAKGIVFDVRGNPGGLLKELLKALDHILPEGEMFVSRDEDGTETVKKSDASCVKLPMTVLIDENTYSAAEYFAAVLSEYNWAKTVGAKTSGKSRSQITIDLGDGTAVHISTEGYLTPKRVDLAEQGGLTPDVPAALSEDDENKLLSGQLAHDADAQLQAAISTLKDEIGG